MRLYDSSVSANCYKVRLLAANLGLELERVPVDIFTGEAGTDEHLARNPAGRTPVLELDSGEYLPESGAILLFLAEGTSLLPTDPYERARAAAWIFFEQNLLEPNIGTGRFWLLTGRAAGNEALLERWRDMGEKALDVLERQLAATPFLLGETLLRRRHRALRLHARCAGARPRPRPLPRCHRVAAPRRGAAGLSERPRAVPAARRCRRRLGPRLSRGLVGPAEREMLLGGA